MILFCFTKILDIAFYMTHIFDSEVSLHYWMLWPTVRHLTQRGLLSAKNDTVPSFLHLGRGLPPARQLTSLGAARLAQKMTQFLPTQRWGKVLKNSGDKSTLQIFTQ